VYVFLVFNLLPCLIFLVEEAVLCVDLILVSVEFKIDFISKIIVLIVVVISNCISVWTFFHTQDSFQFNCLSTGLLGFMFFMYVFLLSNNFFVLFVRWDALACTSYLLICYFNNWDLKFNGSFVMLINKLGDSFLIWALSRSLFFIDRNLLILRTSVICGLVFCTFSGKSSYALFFSWPFLSIFASPSVCPFIYSRVLVCSLSVLEVKLSLLDGNVVEFCTNCVMLVYSGVLFICSLPFWSFISRVFCCGVSFFGLF